MIYLLFGVVLFLAFSNGANDNFKGVATLLGSATQSYRQALVWATTTTFAGSVASVFLAQGLVRTFSGRGLVSESLIGNPIFLVAVGLGAAVTVFAASIT